MAVVPGMCLSSVDLLYKAGMARVQVLNWDSFGGMDVDIDFLAGIGHQTLLLQSRASLRSGVQEHKLLGKVVPAHESFEKAINICYGLANDGLCNEKG